MSLSSRPSQLLMILILKMFLPPISRRKTEATKQDLLQSPQPTTIFSFSLRGRVGSPLFQKPNYPTSFGFKQLSSLFFFLSTTLLALKASSLSLCVQLSHLIKKLLTYEIHWYLQFSLKYIHKIRWVDECIDGQICDKPNIACTYANPLMILLLNLSLSP